VNIKGLADVVTRHTTALTTPLHQRLWDEERTRSLQFADLARAVAEIKGHLGLGPTPEPARETKTTKPRMSMWVHGKTYAPGDTVLHANRYWRSLIEVRDVEPSDHVPGCWEELR
jgi:hypothetical protein